MQVEAPAPTGTEPPAPATLAGPSASTVEAVLARGQAVIAEANLKVLQDRTAAVNAQLADTASAIAGGDAQAAVRISADATKMSAEKIWLEAVDAVADQYTEYCTNSITHWN